MNILHVLSQFEVTGAEAYAVTLMDAQLRAGHLATVVSDTLTLPTKATYIQLPIGQRSYAQRLRNIAALRHLIRKRSIDLVHAHSRAASWVSWFATRLTGAAFVSTVHGRQHIHPSSRSFNIYGKRIIAISPALKEHLANDLGIPQRFVTVVPNCIACQYWDNTRASFRPDPAGTEAAVNLILFVGRLTGPKGDIVRALLQSVLPQLLQKRTVRFRAIGGMITPNDLPPMVTSLNDAFGKPLAELGGFQTNVAEEMMKASVIIGSGRVVPESLLLGVPTVAFGESNYVGPVTVSSFEQALATNFGDTGVRTPVDGKRIAADVLQLLDQPPTKPEKAELARLTRERFDVHAVTKTILDIYERASADARSPRSVPVLMYHRVIADADEPPKHGTWVREREFARQLQSLHRRGFTTITFRQYQEFLSGEKPFPRRPIILTFDDGYIDNYALAFPLLQKFGFNAVIYVVTDPDRRTNFWERDEQRASLMKAEQIKELHRAGIEIGSHTQTHPRLTDVDGITVRAEVVESKRQLEAILGAEVVSFAYPFGALNSSVKEIVRSAGYRFAVAADSGPMSIQDDFLEIRRTQVFPWTHTAGFWKKTLPFYQRYKELKVRN